MPPVTTPGRSAARDNLSSASDSSYQPDNDSDRNSQDFCRQNTPNPGALNVRPGC